MPGQTLCHGGTARANPGALAPPLCIEEEVFEISNLTVDTRTHRVTLESTPVHLARKEFMVLAYLLRNRGSVVTRDMLLEHVWSQEVDPLSNTVTAHVRSLRRKLDNGTKPLIHTIAGTGYKIDLAEPAA